MRIGWKALLVVFSLSCTSAQKSSISPQDQIKNPKKPKVSLPVCLDFDDNPVHDSIIQRLTACFDQKNIQMITKERMFAVGKAEYSRATENANIKWGEEAKDIMRQVEQQIKYVANHIRIDFSFTDYQSKQFRLKWFNELVPIKVTTYTKKEWMQVDSTILKNYSWPESLKVAVESIITSGKLQ